MRAAQCPVLGSHELYSLTSAIAGRTQDRTSYKVTYPSDKSHTRLTSHIPVRQVTFPSDKSLQFDQCSVLSSHESYFPTTARACQTQEGMSDTMVRQVAAVPQCFTLKTHESYSPIGAIACRKPADKRVAAMAPVLGLGGHDFVRITN